MDSDSESQLISLITQLLSIQIPLLHHLESYSKVTPHIIQIIHLVRSMDLDSQPKPESKLMSLVTQTISVFNSMDLDSQPKLLSEFISLITHPEDLDLDPYKCMPFLTLLNQSRELEPKSELMSLIHQILSLVISMNSKWVKLISLSPQVKVSFEDGKFHVREEIQWWRTNKWGCLSLGWKNFELRKEEDATHFLCRNCYGKNHEEYEKAPVEIKHPLHPKHFLQLVLFEGHNKTRECYCCDEELKEVFYYCSVCDYALNIACLEKQPVLSIDQPKWHKHTLVHFPRQSPLTCDVCALTHSICPFYICPHCGFVVHKSCINLPRVIRISRHPHRISFTPSFDQRDWSCGVCRRKIENDYGGYSCIKEGCSYGAHSKCATQSNVWDGIDLEGKPEEIEEEVESFVRINDGIIQHFSHEQHHLRLDENTSRDYDEDKLCQACITPIYFGNFYSCMQCEFFLHEECANLSRRIHHPIHPHILTLVEINDNVVETVYNCGACFRGITAGFSYECSEEGCNFQVHVECATISEPLVNVSHIHPLFLTSKPGEWRMCLVCKNLKRETFNCIELECKFAMCYGCATIPEKVRYKHDKHTLTLSYGNEKSHETNWCEACERKINQEHGFYMCGEYCCVTLHIDCILGNDFNMKSGSSLFNNGRKVDILPNNKHMSRPICSFCNKRCTDKVVFQCYASVFCSSLCF